MKCTLAALVGSALFGADAARWRNPMLLQGAASCQEHMSQAECASAIARTIVGRSKECFQQHSSDEASYQACTADFCQRQCGNKFKGCQDLCTSHANPLFAEFAKKTHAHDAQLHAQVQQAADEEAAAMAELRQAQGRMQHLNAKIAAHAEKAMQSGKTEEGRAELAKAEQLSKLQEQIDEHLANVAHFRGLAESGSRQAAVPAFLQSNSAHRGAPEDDLAKEMTHDLEMNFNKIAPFGKEDTAKELQDHAAKTQDTLVDAVENAEVAEIKRAVFRALTRLRAATIKEFDTIARLETQAIDAYNDAHHYRAENPLAHLHEDEAPVETDKLKSFH